MTADPPGCATALGSDFGAACSRAVLSVTAVLMVSACQAGTGSGPAEEPAGTAPLQVSAAIGGSGLYPPARSLWSHDTWQGSFGGFVLCTSGGAAVRLVDVRFHSDVQPDHARVYLRSVPPRPPGSAAPGYDPIGSALGSPPTFDEPYVTQTVRGLFSRQVAGVEVNRPCDGQGSRAETGFQEIVFTMRAGAEGARINSADILYEFRGERHALSVDWTMVLCGSRLDADTCPRASSS